MHNKEYASPMHITRRSSGTQKTRPLTRRYAYNYISMKRILVTLLIIILSSCSKHGKTELEMVFDRLKNDHKSAMVDFNKGLGLFFEGIPRTREIVQLLDKKRESVKSGSKLSDEHKERLRILLEENEVDTKFIKSSTTKFTQISVKIFALAAVSYNKCELKKVTKTITKMLSSVENKYQPMSDNLLDVYNTNRLEYRKQFHSYNFNDDCDWLDKKKDIIVNDIQQSLEMIKRRA